MEATTFANAGRKMKPTLKHRPAITFGILGTWYAVSPEGEVKYFDYDRAGALEFAGVTEENLAELDPRFAPAPREVCLPGHDMWHPERRVTRGQRAWWVL